MKKILWNDPEALLKKAEELGREGFPFAVEGILERIARLKYLLPLVTKKPHLARLLEEPVDVKFQG